jgi:hypothetical protein
MRTIEIWRLLAVVALAAGSAKAIAAQESQTTTRQAIIEKEQAEKATTLHPYELSKAERIMNRSEDVLINGNLHWHPFFESAYAGGGFTLGAGYMRHVSAYSVLDVRGSWTVANYKRAEAAFTSPHLFQRRGSLLLLGGWREATQVGFYGFGTDTSKHDRVNYDFRQPYASGLLEFKPTRRLWLVRGGFEWTQWDQRSGHGTFPSVDTVFTPETLPGLDAKVTYLHTQATAGFDWRTSPGYSRRGGFYGVTAHDYHDTDNDFGFRQVDYEVIQHFPILREAWVISLHGLAQTTYTKDDEAIPFFMMPSVGGGSSLRGFSSWRFRDRHSLLLQAEWRIMANQFLDSAVFYDAGKVTDRRSHLNLDNLKSDYGFGVRFHGPLSTALRAELARSNEGLRLVFTVSPAF